MKKILAIVLALCLTLSLSVVAFATASPAPSSPVLPGSTPQGSGAPTVADFSYTAVDANGNKVTANIQPLKSGEIFDELKDAGLVALYEVVRISAPDDAIVTITVNAPGVAETDVVIVRDAWETLPEVTMVAKADKAEITGPAGVFNQWHYVAIVKADSEIVVDTPQEAGDTEETDENVEEPGDTVEAPADEPAPAPAPAPADDDANPGTGIALAVVPMIVAAAAVVVSKKR